MFQTAVLIVGTSFATLAGWVGAHLRFGARYEWIAGFNAASPDEKEKYDIEGLSHHLGNGLITIGVLLASATLAAVLERGVWLTASITLLVFVAAIIVIGGQKFTPAARFPPTGESGHTSHRFLRLVLPTRAYRALEAGTRWWQIECGCGQDDDYWNAGGIRYKAVGEPRQLRKCDRCGRVSMQRVCRKSVCTPLIGSAQAP